MASWTKALKAFGVGFSIGGVGYLTSANTSFNWKFSTNSSTNNQIWAAVSENQWETESKKCMERLLDLRDNPAHKWEQQPDKDGIQIKRLIDPNSSVVMMRGEGKINASPKKIVEALGDLNERKKWDPHFIERKVTEQVREDADGLNKLFVSHMKFNAPAAIISPRDFCTLSGSAYNPQTGKAIVFSQSIKHEKTPEVSGFVRGELLTSGYIIEPSNAEKTQSNVTYIVQLDPKGWLPKTVVNTVASDQPKTLASLRNFIHGKQQ